MTWPAPIAGIPPDDHTRESWALYRSVLGEGMQLPVPDADQFNDGPTAQFLQHRKALESSRASAAARAGAA